MHSDAPPPLCNHVGGLLNLFMATNGYAWIMTESFEFGMLSTFHVSSRIVVNISGSSVCFAGDKHYKKITIRILKPVLQNFAVPDCFPYIIFCRYLVYLLSSGWFVFVVCGSISVRELVEYLGSLKTNIFSFLKVNWGLQIVCFLCKGR